MDRDRSVGRAKNLAVLFSGGQFRVATKKQREDQATWVAGL